MRFLQTQSSKLPIDKSPPECPRCSRLISAIFTGVLDESQSSYLEAIFRCPNCSRHFVGFYSYDYGSASHLFRGVLPKTPVALKFPLVDLISIRFSEIYNQAAAAEQYGLSDIAGTGYRKALEFLIKDYCVALAPSDSELIRKKFLKNVIDDHLEDGKLKKAATLTTWLGNDEGHYERRWVDKDLGDLKALLSLTITFVNEEIQLEQYLRSMQPDGPQRLVLREITTEGKSN
jgi:hypothetical protein